MLAPALAGCEAMEKLNPFIEQKTPLPGERKPLFPSGVPGVELNAPPQQPQNSNIPINAMIGEQDPDRPVAEPEPQADERSAAKSPPKAAAKPAPKQTSKSASRPASRPDADDPWVGTR
jgi:hypothetical protein